MSSKTMKMSRSRSRSRSYSRKSPPARSPSRDENYTSKGFNFQYHHNRAETQAKRFMPFRNNGTNFYHRNNKPSRSVSRDKTNDRAKGRRRSRSRSRSSRRYRTKSKSYSPPRRRDRRRSFSRSPRRYVQNRDNPPKNRCLGVFGLSVYTTQAQIIQIFSKFGPIERVQVVVDAKTGRSRGFCFVYFERVEDAKAAKDQCSGMEIDSRIIRVDYSTTHRPHSPTPGVYMGRARHRDYGDRSSYREDDEYYEKRPRRSPSPQYYRTDRRRRYDRSRSRSYSPKDRRYR